MLQQQDAAAWFLSVLQMCSKSVREKVKHWTGQCLRLCVCDKVRCSLRCSMAALWSVSLLAQRFHTAAHISVVTDSQLFIFLSIPKKQAFYYYYLLAIRKPTFYICFL